MTTNSMEEVLKGEKEIKNNTVEVPAETTEQNMDGKHMLSHEENQKLAETRFVAENLVKSISEDKVSPKKKGLLSLATEAAQKIFSSSPERQAEKAQKKIKKEIANLKAQLKEDIEVLMATGTSNGTAGVSRGVIANEDVVKYELPQNEVDELKEMIRVDRKDENSNERPMLKIKIKNAKIAIADKMRKSVADQIKQLEGK